MKKNRKRNRKYIPQEWDEEKSVFVIPNDGLKGVSTSIRLPQDMIEKLKKIAQKKGGIGYQTLLKIWIAERLEKETA
jgi:hypothetical protein